MKNTMKIGAFLGALALALAAPTAHAATEIGGYPCYGTTMIEGANPCDTANNNVVRDAWKYASITGWNGPTSQPVGQADDSKARIAALEQQNATLQSQVQALTQKVNQLMNQQPAAPVQQVTQVVSGNYDARITAIEKEQKIVSGYMYILEQRIGENYARMMDLFAPVYKILKLK